MEIKSKHHNIPNMFSKTLNMQNIITKLLLQYNSITYPKQFQFRNSNELCYTFVYLYVENNNLTL